MQYYLMQKNHKVAGILINDEKFTVDKVGEVFIPERVPVGVTVRNGHIDKAELNEWLCDRSIQPTRDGIDGDLETLGVSLQALPIKALGLSLSDGYWICPQDKTYRWEDINFFDNTFSESLGNLLIGEAPSDKISLMSPDCTTDGWLRKKWTIKDNKRYLIKGAGGKYKQEPYNEAIACAVMRRLGIPHIGYSVMIRNGKPYSVCEDFIDSNTELVTAWRIINTMKKSNHVSMYRHFLNCCEHLGIDGAEDFLDGMLTTDFIIANEDRHLNNFGVIRDTETLHYIGFAPIYDSGTSLWLDFPTGLIDYKNGGSKPFKTSHNEQIKLVRSFEKFDIGKLYGIGEECRKILRSSEYMDDVRKSKICRRIENRVKMLSEIIATHKAEIIDNTANDVRQNTAYSGNFKKTE